MDGYYFINLFYDLVFYLYCSKHCDCSSAEKGII